MENLEKPPTTWPSRVGLFNVFNGVPHIMEFQSLVECSLLKTIRSGSDPNKWVGDIYVGSYFFRCLVNQAGLVSAFRVSLIGASESYREEFQSVRVIIEMDKERVIDAHYSGAEQLPLVKPKQSTQQFHAVDIKKAGWVDPADWIGYFAPNGTKLDACLGSVPGGGGVIQVKVDWIIGLYQAGSQHEKA